MLGSGVESVLVSGSGGRVSVRVRVSGVDVRGVAAHLLDCLARLEAVHAHLVRVRVRVRGRGRGSGRGRRRRATARPRASPC